MTNRKSEIDNRQSRNIWRDGLWIGAVAFVIVCIGTGYQLWLHLGPEARAARSKYQGDGFNVESYGFDLSRMPKNVDVTNIKATGMRRDEVPILDAPGYITVEENSKLTGHEKYVLPTDRVIGVFEDGQARAYPIQVMQVHQLVNIDQYAEIGGGDAIVYDPATELVAECSNGSINTDTESWYRFGLSGLSYGAQQLLYVRLICTIPEKQYITPKVTPPLEEDLGLIRPIEGLAIVGWHSGYRDEFYSTHPGDFNHGFHFDQVNVSVLQWRDWLTLHPDSVIVERDENLIQEYKKDLYGADQMSSRIAYEPLISVPPQALQEMGISAKERGIGIVVFFNEGGAVPVFVPHTVAIDNARFNSAGLGKWQVNIDKSPDVFATFHCRKADVGFTPTTVWATEYMVPKADGTKYLRVYQPAALAMFYAWYDAFPATYVLQGDGTLVKP